MSNPSNVDTPPEGSSRAALMEQLVRRRLARHDGATASVHTAPTTTDVTVTPLQRSLWLHGERCGHGNRQLLTWGASLTGKIDVEALLAALRTVAADPALRVTFAMVDDDLQCRPALRSDPVVFIDRSRELAQLTESHRVIAGRQSIAGRVEDVDSGHNVLAVTCVRIDTNHLLISLIAHHLIFDGRSLRLFLDRVARCYRERNQDLLRGAEVPWRPYAPLRSETEESAAYWAVTLADHPPGLVPTRSSESGGAGRVDVLVAAETTSGLRLLATDSHATLFMVLFVGVAITLRRAGAPADVVIGVPVDTRRPNELDSFGYFVNTLPFRLRWNDKATAFDSLVKEARAVITNGLGHRDAALADIMASLRVSREATASIFDVALNFLADTDDELHLAGVTCEPFDLEVAQPEFGLTITVRDDGPELDIVLEYAPRFLDATGAEQLGRMMVEVLDEISVDPPSTIDFTTRAELFRTGEAPKMASPKQIPHAPDESDLQSVVAEVFVEVLEASAPLTIDDDFFRLGGFSMHATQIAASLGRRHSVTLTLADIFDNSTIGELAALIATKIRR